MFCKPLLPTVPSCTQCGGMAYAMPAVHIVICGAHFILIKEGVPALAVLHRSYVARLQAVRQSFVISITWTSSSNVFFPRLQCITCLGFLLTKSLITLRQWLMQCKVFFLWSVKRGEGGALRDVLVPMLPTPKHHEAIQDLFVDNHLPRLSGSRRFSQAQCLHVFAFSVGTRRSEVLSNLCRVSASSVV